MSIKTSVCAVALIACSAGAATAADLGPYTPPPPPPEYAPEMPALTWTGFYIGANGGYAWSNGNSDDFGRISPEGWFGGGTAGYNVQSGRFVFGVEADAQAGDISDSGVGPAGFAKATTDWFGTVRARAGITSGPALFYATGGFAWADMDYNVNGFRDDSMETGWVAGGGVEWKLDDRWSTKLEYQYIDLGDQRVADGFGEIEKFDNNFHTVRLGLNYKF